MTNGALERSDNRAADGQGYATGLTGSYSSDDSDRPRWDRDTEIECAYDYEHENGTYAYSNLKGRRSDGEKTFLRGRRVCGTNDHLLAQQENELYRLSGLESYRKGAGGEPDLLYRLPNFIASTLADPNAPVFICEGEKDVESLIQLGLIATTNPNGALNWNSDFNGFFRGRDVVIMIDNDEKGRQRASRVLSELKPVATSVKLVELPNLRLNGDVSDWLDAGNTKEQLLTFVGEVDADSPPGWAMQSIDAIEFDRLAALSPVQFDRERKAAAQRLGIKLSTLDSEVEARRATERTPEASGTALEFHDVEPCDDPVCGVALINELLLTLKRHVVFPSDHHALAVVLWIIHAYFLAEAEHSPRLHITAPTKACGKTVLLNSVASLVPRPLRVEHVTPPALFRVIEEHQPTLLIDEADTFLNNNEDMRGLLNAGHQPDTRVVRCVGENQDVRGFSVFAAVALAGIGDIPATIEDRSITVPLRRRVQSDEKIERLRRTRPQFADLARKIARWAADNRDRLVEDPAMPEELGDRAQDNWRLMIAIADAVGEPLASAARKAACVLELERDHDDSDAGLMALTDVHSAFGHSSERLSSQFIVEALVAMKDRPWSQWRHGNQLTPNSLARLLKPFGIKPKQIKAFNGKGYERGPVVEAFQRYCASKGDGEIPNVDDPI